MALANDEEVLGRNVAVGLTEIFGASASESSMKSLESRGRLVY